MAKRLKKETAEAVTIPIAQKFAPLLKEKKRIKFYYGGRAGGKSYAFADSLLLLGRQKKILVACLREIQESIKDSVHKLLSDRIALFGLSDYKVYETRIENKITGSKFIFKGLRDQDIQKIKSLEGVDIAWIEEAQTITKKSWSILEPTIRKDGSEIWISMNRETETDALWHLLAEKPDERTFVCRVNYDDNPFCPEEIKIQAEKCRKESPEDYAHIWLGAPVSQAACRLIDAADIRSAFEEKIDECGSPLLIGLDIARFGDDKTSFCFRRGRLCQRFETFSKLDNVEVADKAAFYIKQYQPKRVFMDIGGQGAGVFDILKDRGFGEVIRSVCFGGKARDSERFINRRAEMWGNLCEWLKSKPEVQLPYDEELFEELAAVQKKYDKYGRLQLEDKDELKKRLGRSPDKGDALALTFAEPVYDDAVPRLYGNGKVSVEDMFFENEKRRSKEW